MPRETVVTNDDNTPVGFAVKWNPCGLGECIVQFYDGSADSCIFSELKFLYGSDVARNYLDGKEY